MNIELKKILIPLLIAFLTASVLFIMRGIAFCLLHRWAEKTETKLDDIIIQAFKTPSIYWCLAIGLYIGVAVSELPQKYIFYLSKTIHIIVILSITVAAANLSGKIFRNYIRNRVFPFPQQALHMAY